MAAKIKPEHIKIAEMNGISYTTLYNRVRKLKWPIERATTELPLSEEQRMERILKHRKNMRSNLWSSDGGTFVRCPVDGCIHVGDIITKTHCRLEHGMERDEVKKKYGMPYKVDINAQKKFKNKLL